MSACSIFDKPECQAVKTEFTIPPTSLVTPVVEYVCPVPEDQLLTNKDLFKYIQFLEEQLDIQKGNYVEFHRWRDTMVAKEKKLNEDL